MPKRTVYEQEVVVERPNKSQAKRSSRCSRDPDSISAVQLLLGLIAICVEWVVIAGVLILFFIATLYASMAVGNWLGIE